jgi:hypothetical protein
MFDILVQPVFEGGLKVLESIGAGCHRAEKGVSRAERDREVLGDPLGKLRGNVTLPHRRIVAGIETVDGRNGQFVVDAGIVDAERGREKAIADDLVGDAFSERNERDNGMASVGRREASADAPACRAQQIAQASSWARCSPP